MVVVGAGWLGRALADATGVEPIARRSFTPDRVPPGSTLLVASGRAAAAPGATAADVIATELDHLRVVLDAAMAAGCPRVVVLGSSDVAGVAPIIRGSTPAAPRTTYARAKAAVEEECARRRADGLEVTVARLAPVHGPGKARTTTLVRLARRPVLPLPGGGRHSVGFVLLDDAVRALSALALEGGPSIVSIGAGPTPLAHLLRALAEAQGRRLRIVPVPVPERFAAWTQDIAALQWAGRLALPRAVELEVNVPLTALADAARSLVRTAP